MAKKKKKINSRAKGQKGELELAHYLNGKGYEARRGQQFSGGADSPDVICPSLPFHIECKRVERLQLYEALKQAIRDCGDSGKVPTVFHRKNREEWVVILKADDFLQLVDKVLEIEI